jgi:hypothetical protein
VPPGAPQLVLLSAPTSMQRDQPAVVSAQMDGLRPQDTFVLDLHVRTPGGQWRTYPMTLMRAGKGTIGAAEFPIWLLDRSGKAPYYVSARTDAGESYFTEIYGL